MGSCSPPTDSELGGVVRILPISLPCRTLQLALERATSLHQFCVSPTRSLNMGSELGSVQKTAQFCFGKSLVRAHFNQRSLVRRSMRPFMLGKRDKPSPVLCQRKENLNKEFLTRLLRSLSTSPVLCQRKENLNKEFLTRLLRSLSTAWVLVSHPQHVT